MFVSFSLRDLLNKIIAESSEDTSLKPEDLEVVVDFYSRNLSKKKAAEDGGDSGGGGGGGLLSLFCCLISRYFSIISN